MFFHVLAMKWKDWAFDYGWCCFVLHPCMPCWKLKASNMQHTIQELKATPIQQRIEACICIFVRPKERKYMLKREVKSVFRKCPVGCDWNYRRNILMKTILTHTAPSCGHRCVCGLVKLILRIKNSNDRLQKCWKVLFWWFQRNVLIFLSKCLRRTKSKHWMFWLAPEDYLKYCVT